MRGNSRLPVLRGGRQCARRRRVGLGAGGGGHGGQARWVGEQAGERFEQLAGNGQVGFLEHDGGAGIDHFFGVALLVIVGGGGKGNEQAGFPAAASSATEDAPLRAMTKLARAKQSGMSSRKGRTVQRSGSAPVAAYASKVVAA